MFGILAYRAGMIGCGVGGGYTSRGWRSHVGPPLLNTPQSNGGGGAELYRPVTIGGKTNRLKT